MPMNSAAQKYRVRGVLVDSRRDNLVCAIVGRERRPIRRACASGRQTRQNLRRGYLIAHAGEIGGKAPAVVFGPEPTSQTNGNNRTRAAERLRSPLCSMGSDDENNCSGDENYEKANQHEASNAHVA